MEGQVIDSSNIGKYAASQVCTTNQDTNTNQAMYCHLGYLQGEVFRMVITFTVYGLPY